MDGTAKAKGRVLLACGGLRSGSTLQYNLLGEYVERLRAGRRLGYVKPAQAHVLLDLPSVIDAIGIGVVKSHELSSGFRDNQGHDFAWRDWHEQGRLLAVYSVRDWRDVVASIARKFGMAPADVVRSDHWRENIANLEAWLDLGAFVQRYEDLQAHPGKALRDLASYAGVPYRPLVARGTVRAVAIAPMRRVADDLPEGVWNARTLVHWDHIDSPQGGAWAAWPAAERDVVEESIAPLMRRFGYTSSSTSR